MSTTVDSALLKKTQDELGKYVKKPQLTEKLLNKPPFRFLHDIINVIISEHGFLSGLFTEEELSSQNIKDKDAKIAFLQKCIDATSLAVGDKLSARPSKIVAGHEADKTNEWLQALALAISQNINSAEAVEQVLNGVKPEKPKRADKEKPDKKSEKGKKERRVAGNNSRNNREPKPTRNIKPTKDPKPNRPTKDPKPSRDPKPPPRNSKANRDPKAGNEARNAPADKSPPKRPQENESPVKSTRSKDDKEKKERSKDEKEDGKKSSKGSRERRSKDEKDDKSRRKPKGEASPEKGRTSKSRPGSRMTKPKDSGKENSPPHEVIGGPEMIPNGHVAAEEMDSAPRLTSARPPSARSGDIVPEEGAAVEQDEGIVTEESPAAADFKSSPDLVEPVADGVNDNQGVRVAEDGGIMSAGPESLIQVDGDTGGEGENPPVISRSPVSENNIDPAILKAMGQQDQLQDEGGGNGGPTPREPPDSGVGSLESPKSMSNSPENPPAAPPPASVQTPRPPGGGPLRALEQFGDESAPMPPPMPPQFSQDKEEVPPPGTDNRAIRPRTGRRSARPPSARPAPPKVRERREIPKEEMSRPGTSKPVANVILSTTSAMENDDADDNFMVEESKPTIIEDAMPLESTTANSSVAATVGEDGEGAGLLVAQILETKKELEDGRRNAFSPETPGHRRVQIEQTLLSDANRRKEREIIQKDVQKLSGSIQSLTRSVNPLAKMLDYLQEDLDSMQKELENWRHENKQLGQTLKREESLTEQELEPLKAQLAELESAVQEQRDKISAVKSNILRNGDKISRLMAGINLNI